MNTIDIAGKTHTITGQLPNGAYYLEGPRGAVVFAKPVTDDLFTFHPARSKGAISVDGHPFTATRAQLAN